MAELVRGSRQRVVAYLMASDGEGEYVLSEAKKRRSLTANAYYWAMLNKLAGVLGMPESEVHRNMLREYGVCEVLCIDCRVPLDDYFEHYDVVSTYRADGRDAAMVKVYKGSSKMDSAEFSRLVNGMRDECEAQGIDVMTPSEIASLRFVQAD